MILQDVRQIVNAFSRVVTALKTAISPFIFSGYRRMPLAGFSLERVIIRALMIVSLGAVATVPTLALAKTPTSTAESLPVIALPEAVRLALSDHPFVKLRSAQVCQSVHRLGLTRAESLPQISGSVSGTRTLFDHFSTKNNGETNRAELRGATASEQNVYDIDVSLTKTVWDWHSSDNKIKTNQLEYDAKRIELQLTVSEQLSEIIAQSLQLDAWEKQIALHNAALADIAPHIEAIEAQGNAGLIRFIDVRQAKLSVLDAEINLKEAESARDRIIKILDSSYRLLPADARSLLLQYLSIRPIEVDRVGAELTEAVRAIDLKIRQSQFQQDVIKSERLPRVSFVLDTKIFDLADYEDEFEVTGKLDVRMPLYDGGSNKARLAEASWRRQELDEEKRRKIRDINTQYSQINHREKTLTALLDDLAIRRTSQEQRIISQQALLNKADISRLEMAQAVIALADTKAQEITTNSQIEELRIKSLYLSDNLVPLLRLSVGERTC